jgi:hypothetical protein
VKNLMKTAALSSVLALALTGAAFAQAAPTVTLQNQSGEAALVKLVGPTPSVVSVPQNTNRTVEVAGGRYYLLVRYGTSGHYHYTKGDPFYVTQTPTEVSDISITLHKVIGGNYHTHPIGPSDFEQ